MEGGRRCDNGGGGGGGGGGVKDVSYCREGILPQKVRQRANRTSSTSNDGVEPRGNTQRKFGDEKSGHLQRRQLSECWGVGYQSESEL